MREACRREWKGRSRQRVNGGARSSELLGSGTTGWDGDGKVARVSSDVGYSGSKSGDSRAACRTVNRNGEGRVSEDR